MGVLACDSPEVGKLKKTLRSTEDSVHSIMIETRNLHRDGRCRTVDPYKREDLKCPENVKDFNAYRDPYPRDRSYMMDCIYQAECVKRGEEKKATGRHVSIIRCDVDDKIQRVVGLEWDDSNPDEYFTESLSMRDWSAENHDMSVEVDIAVADPGKSEEENKFDYSDGEQYIHCASDREELAKNSSLSLACGVKDVKKMIYVSPDVIKGTRDDLIDYSAWLKTLEM